MANNDLVKIILDNRKGCVEKYSNEQSAKIIREALIDMNGGTKLNLKSLRRNPELFDIIEEVVSKTVSEGFEQSDFFNMLVDEKDLGEMDACQWKVPRNGSFVVSSIARGNQAIRRQRIPENGTITLTPEPLAVKCYDELTRVLAGKIDMNEMLDLISKGVSAKRFQMIYNILNGLTATELGANYVFSGTYAEDSVLDVCNHVSAANSGSKVLIYGTQKSVRNLGVSVDSDARKQDYYNNGYATRWNGVDVIMTPQRHTPGTDNFMLDDDKLYIFPVGMDKPIKAAKAEGMISITDGKDDLSLQPEIFYLDQYATGALVGQKFGMVDLT